MQAKVARWPVDDQGRGIGRGGRGEGVVGGGGVHVDVAEGQRSTHRGGGCAPAPRRAGIGRSVEGENFRSVNPQRVAGGRAQQLRECLASL